MQSYIHAPDSWKAHSKGLEGGSGELLHEFSPSHSKQANQFSLLPVVSVGNRKKLPLTLEACHYSGVWIYVFCHSDTERATWKIF